MRRDQPIVACTLEWQPGVGTGCGQIKTKHFDSLHKGRKLFNRGRFFVDRPVQDLGECDRRRYKFVRVALTGPAA